MIIVNCTSRFFEIPTDWWNALEIADQNTYLISQYFSINFKSLQEVFCRDTNYTNQAIFQALNSLYNKESIPKKIIQNNPAIDLQHNRNNLIMMSNFPWSRVRQDPKENQRSGDSNNLGLQKIRLRKLGKLGISDEGSQQTTRKIMIAASFI